MFANECIEEQEKVKYVFNVQNFETLGLWLWKACSYIRIDSSVSTLIICIFENVYVWSIYRNCIIMPI